MRVLLLTVRIKSGMAQLPLSRLLAVLFRSRPISQASRLHPASPSPPPRLSKEALEKLNAASEHAAAVMKDFEGMEQLPEAIREANEVRRVLTRQLAERKK